MRERSSRRYKSSSRERDDRRRDRSHKPKKYKKSKKSKKYSRRSSSSSSSTSSYDSRDYRSSSRRSRTRSESNSRTSKKLPASSENSRSSMIPKTIDLTDDHVKEELMIIEEDRFEAKTFFSTRDREAPTKVANEKVVIDLNNETVQIPKPTEIKDIKEQIFHPNFLGDSDLRSEKWVRKLYNFRKKNFED